MRLSIILQCLVAFDLRNLNERLPIIGADIGIGFDEMIELDLDYVRRVSVLTDLGVILRTAGAVFGGRGAY